MSINKAKMVSFMVFREAELLTDWDDESGESVTANDATIVHDILRSNLPKETEKEM